MAVVTALDLYRKVDYEGDDGLTWFEGDTFEDPQLQEKFDLALSSYDNFQNDMNDLMNYVEEVMVDANEIRPSGT